MRNQEFYEEIFFTFSIFLIFYCYSLHHLTFTVFLFLFLFFMLSWIALKRFLLSFRSAARLDSLLIESLSAPHAMALKGEVLGNFL
jgi:hypothetical protein